MKKRRDRNTPPHVRIPDEFYLLLSYFTPREMTLLLALLCQTWRAEGPRKGECKKSLKQISADIGMSWGSVVRAFNGLRLKGFAKRKDGKIHVACDLFATTFGSGIATLVGPDPPVHSGQGGSPVIRGGSPVIRGGITRDHPTGVNENGVKGLTHGRSDQGNRGNRRAREDDARASDGATYQRSERRSSFARSQGSLSPSSGGAKEKEEKISRDDAKRWIRELHRAAGSVPPVFPRRMSADEQQQREELLRRQAEELLNEERKIE